MFSVDIICSEKERNQIGKQGQQTLTTKANTKKKEQKKERKENCSTIKANKFHRTADTITTQKANKVETQRTEFKGLITTHRDAPKQTESDHIAGKFSGSQEINNTQRD